MGGWMNMLLGLTPGASQAAVLPNTGSLAYLAAHPPQTTLAATSGAGSNPFTTTSSAPGSATGSSGSPAGSTGGGGGAVGAVGSPAGGGGTGNFTPGQVSAYRGGVENALNSIYSNVAGKVQAAEGPLYGGPAGAEGGAELLNYGAPGQGPVPGAPVLSAEQKALLGPGITSGFPWGPGISNVPGSNVSGPRQLLQSLMAGEEGTQTGFVPSTSQAFTQNVTGLGTSPWFIPGSAPQTFFPANVFGDVTGAAQGVGGASTTGSQPAPILGQQPSWLTQQSAFAPFF